MTPRPLHRCDNCSRSWEPDDLEEAADRIRDLANDAGPGETLVIPSGLCPECGACAYPLSGPESAVVQIASGVPTKVDSWRSAADFMEFTARVLDRHKIERPDHYDEE